MFIELHSGSDICLSHIVSVKQTRESDPKTDTSPAVQLELSNGKIVNLAGVTKDEIKKEITDAYSLAANNTLAYMQFEKYSKNILDALAQCATLMTKAGKASEVTQDVMRAIDNESYALSNAIKKISRPTQELKSTVTKLKRIVNDD